MEPRGVPLAHSVERGKHKEHEAGFGKEPLADGKALTKEG